MLYDFLEDTFGEGTSDVVAKLLIVVLILIATWLARRVVMALMPRVARFVDERTRTKIDDQIVTIIREPLRFLINVLGLWLALRVLAPPDPLSNVLDQFVASLIAFALFWGIYRSVDLVVRVFWRLGRRTMVDTPVTTLLDDQLARVVSQIAKAIVLVFAVTVIMEEWGYNVGGLVAGLGLGGLAVALASQDALANLIGYFMIIADKPYVEGEYIVIGDVSGTVEGIGFRSTRVRVLDQSLVTVPNKTAANANVTNWSRLAKRRLNMTLGIEYGSSPEQVLSVVQAIREMLQNHELVQDDSVIVQFNNFNDSWLDIIIICFMSTPGWGDFQAARQDINLKIMNILKDRGVSVAFPSRTLYIERAEAAAQEAAEATQHLPEPKPEPTISTAIDSPVPDDAAN